MAPSSPEGRCETCALVLNSCPGGPSKEEAMSRYPRVIVGIVVLSIAAAACASGGGTSSKTMLDQVKASGKLRVATDPAYPPQSSYDKASGKWEGFDIDVATEVAKRLGVKLQFVTPSWDIITAGDLERPWGRLG